MAGGDFSPEAYEALREAYANQQQEAVDAEIEGHDIMNLTLGLETGPVDSPWAGKIDRWEYPSGRGQHMDERQSPEEILELMREAAQERIDARAEDEKINEDDEDVKEVAEMSDEEFDSMVAEILEETDNDEEEDDEDESESEEDEDEDDSESDEEEVEEEAEDEEENPEDIAEQIAALRAEIEQLQFVQEQPEEAPTDDEQQ